MERNNLHPRPKGLNQIVDRKNTDLNTEVSIPIPAGYALKRLSEITRKTLRSRNILVDQKQVQNPSGPTKTWEIELLLFRVDNRFGSMTLGRPLKGRFSCHRIGTFTTYAVNVAGCEYWFDQLDLAINSLANQKIWKHLN